MNPFNIYDINRRQFLRAGVGAFAASSLVGSSTLTAAQEPIDDTGWMRLSHDGDGAFTGDYTPPLTVAPDGLVGETLLAVYEKNKSGGLGRKVVDAPLGLGIDPRGREYGFLSDTRKGLRARGMVVIEKNADLTGDPGATGRSFSVVFSVAKGYKNAPYELHATYAKEGGWEYLVPPAELTVSGAPESRVSAVVGNEETDVDVDEIDLRIEVVGKGFDNAVLKPGEANEEAEPFRFFPINGIRGYKMIVHEPMIERIKGNLEMELIAGEPAPFRISVERGRSKLDDDDVVVRRRIIVRPPEGATPQIPPEWHQMTPVEGEQGTYYLDWHAPRTADPEGLLGEGSIRCLTGKGDEACRFDFGLGVDPDLREFAFTENNGTGGRIRGMVVIEPRSAISGDPDDKGTVIGVDFGGKKVRPGKKYQLHLHHGPETEKVPVLSEPLTFTADGRGNGGAQLGPASTDVSVDEDELWIKVTGKGFARNNELRPGEVEPFEPEAADPWVVKGDDGYAITVEEPAVELINGAPEVEVIGGDVHRFKASVTKNGTPVDGGDVQWQLIADGKNQKPFAGELPTEEDNREWYAMTHQWSEDKSAGANTVDADLPLTADVGGLLGQLDVVAYTGEWLGPDKTTTVASFRPAEVGVEPNLQRFSFEGSRRGSISGAFTVESPAALGLTDDDSRLGLTIRGMKVVPSEEYYLTLADGSETVTYRFRSDGEGRFSETMSNVDVNLSGDAEIDATLTGPGFGTDVESLPTEFERPPPLDPYPMEGTLPSGESVLLWILSPPVESADGLPEMELPGGERVSFRAKVTDTSVPRDASYDDVLRADHVSDVSLQWSFLVDGEPLSPTGHPSPVETGPTGHPMMYDDSLGANALQWDAPSTLVKEGITGLLDIHATESDNGSSVARFETPDFRVNPKGLHFSFEADEDERAAIDGTVTVEPGPESNSSSAKPNRVGLMLEGKKLEEKERYTVTVTDKNGVTEEFSFKTGRRRRLSVKLSDRPTALSADEGALSVTLAGKRFGENVPPTETELATADLEGDEAYPVQGTLSDRSVTLWILSPTVEAIDRGRKEVGVVGGTTVPFWAKVTDDRDFPSSPNMSVERVLRANRVPGVDISWRLLLEGEEQTPNGA